MAKRRSKTREKLTYKASGVDISANDRMVEKIQHAMRHTYGPRVLSRAGAFAGLMRLDFRERLLKRHYRDPVLVAGADGVGSKLLLGLEHNRIRGLGVDLVAMSVNDVLTIGAEPLFFLDYVACHKLEPDRIAEIVSGISDGCRQAGCALLGGETAEMPALYAPTHFDLAGFCVGVIEHRRIIDGHRHVEPGDAVIGLASNGLHSNGFSLVRKAIRPRSKKSRLAAERLLGEPLAEALLRPTRIYVKPILKLLASYRRKRVIRAMAHITGGGLADNLLRVIPKDCDVHLSRKWPPIPPIFRLIQKCGVSKKEMDRVFNMGIGYVLVVRPAFAESILRRLNRLGESAYRIGTIRRGQGRLLRRG
ncbi:MAG: phosphoribosylformylglycinamidine cyclo-ligase [Phycisphaerales bacterium]|nr:phosphoribosylformylglycinamidine cyclo-ligase [Phycisphaerales bacterium]